MGTWVQHDFIDGQYLYEAAASGTGQIVVASDGSGGLHVSNDYGQSFVTKYDSEVEGLCFTAVAISDDGSVMYAAGYVSLFVGDYIYKSSDYGESWSQLSSPQKGWNNLICSSSGQYVYALDLATATNNDLYFSDDYGATWSAVTTPTLYNKGQFACSSDGQTIYLAGLDSPPTSYDMSVYKSVDYGATWTQVLTHTTTLNYNSYGVASLSCSGDGATVAALMAYCDLYVSTNGGSSWSKKLDYADEKSCWRVLVSSDGSKVIAQVDDNVSLAISSDGGSTFEIEAIGIGSFYFTCGNNDLTRLLGADFEFVYTYETTEEVKRRPKFFTYLID